MKFKVEQELRVYGQVVNAISVPLTESQLIGYGQRLQ